MYFIKLYYKLISSVILMILLLVSFMNPQAWKFKAMELFGENQGYMLTIDSNIYGYVGNSEIGFLIWGEAENCKIVQIHGMEMGNTVPHEGPLSCFMSFKKSQDRFAGWIDFRGHPRPFCGAKENKDYPSKCISY